jgi:uncharacterized membrane protein
LTEQLFSFFLIVHIVGGSIGLISGTIVMLRKKGDKIHKRIGNAFTIGMSMVGISSFILSIIHPNTFLFVVGIFTMYMVITGKRYLKLKMLLKGKKPKPIDYAVSSIMLIASVIFLVKGILSVINSNFFGIVLIVFGALALLMLKDDYLNYSGKAKNENYWLLAHFQRFAGAYISSASAFLVVNFKYLNLDLPGFVVWLLPTAIITPLIFYWTEKNKKPAS